MTSLGVQHVSATYGGPPILSDLSLDVASGEVLAVLGASGSGKTTLLRVLTGFLRPTAGVVRIGDRIVADGATWVPPERRRVGIVPQEGALFPHLDVAGNVGFGLPRGSSARVEEMLALVGMEGLGSRRPQELSGGQQQRVALARALAPAPDVLCLDEPFAALDASLRVRLRGDVRAAVTATGTTAVLVTHDQEEALSLADRVAVVRDGRVVQVATPQELYERPADLATARFVGDAVELAAEVVQEGVVTCALGPVRAAGETRPGAVGTVVLRPEQVALAHDGVPGRVRTRDYHGHDSLLLVAVGAGLLVPVRVPGAHEARPGDEVRVAACGTGVFYPA